MSDVKTPTMTSESLHIIRRGVAALKRLDSDKNWLDWLQVGEAIVECRNVAMREAETNQPFGPRYRTAFARLMQHYHFSERLKDKSDRSKLVAIMDNLPAVEAWRSQLPADDKRKWNHPATVWREYQKAQRKSVEVDTDDVWRKPSVKDQLQAAKSELHRIRKEGGLPWGPADKPAERAQALMEHLSVAEAEELGLALLQLVRAAREAREHDETAEDA